MKPTLSMLLVRVLNSVVNDFQQDTGLPDSRISKNALGHPDGLKALRRFDGAGHSPTIAKLIPIESYLRQNWSEDANESESLYQASVSRALVEHGFANIIDNP